MKQFGKIFKFEAKNYFTNKAFVTVTLIFVAVIAVVMFFPRISHFFQSDAAADPAQLPTMLVVSNAPENTALIEEAFAGGFPGYHVVLTQDSLEEIKSKITSGEVECAFVLESLTNYTYYVNNRSMGDNNAFVADTVLQNLYQIHSLMGGGMTPEEAHNVISIQIEGKTENLGKDQVQNFFYTYIMIFALYMVILLYGQMVATNVATEKSSRAMELLVTSAKPVSMMFGKVLASCVAGLIQLVTIFGSALLLYHVNQEYWAGNAIIASIFGMPVDLFVYMLVFFILGFFIYAFLYGAIGSTASKLEDINTSVMPITMVFVAAFLIVMFSMSEGNVDSVLMKVCSFIPFTSPMAMFTRLAMSTVPSYEVILSIVILVGSVIGVGVISAKIYRVGVLLYGTTPKLGAIIKAIKKA